MQLSPSELQAERNRRGLSQHDLALLSGVAAGAIGRIERTGKANCATMQALSDALIGVVKAEDVHFWRKLGRKEVQS
jgi:transcriptional regulator with XRE-family HTH domain